MRVCDRNLASSASPICRELILSLRNPRACGPASNPFPIPPTLTSFDLPPHVHLFINPFHLNGHVFLSETRPQNSTFLPVWLEVDTRGYPRISYLLTFPVFSGPFRRSRVFPKSPRKREIRIPPPTVPVLQKTRAISHYVSSCDEPCTCERRSNVGILHSLAIVPGYGSRKWKALLTVDTNDTKDALGSLGSVVPLSKKPDT